MKKLNHSNIFNIIHLEIIKDNTSTVCKTFQVEDKMSVCQTLVDHVNVKCHKNTLFYGFYYQPYFFALKSAFAPLAPIT